MYIKYINELICLIESLQNYEKEKDLISLYPEVKDCFSLLNDYNNMLQLLKYEVFIHGEDYGYRTIKLLVGDPIIHIGNCRKEILEIDNKIRNLK